jgi:hypothetical protein
VTLAGAKRALQQFAATVLSPIAEKNPVKALSSIAPVVLSGSRITVGVFTAVDAYRLAHAATIGWPEVTLAIALVFALPVLAGLSKVAPAEAIAFGEKILDRFGVGDVGKAPPPAFEPHEWKSGDPDAGAL